MPIKQLLTIEVETPDGYPQESLTADIEGHLKRQVQQLCEFQARRIGMCGVVADSETPPTFRLVVEEQCALVPVTRTQELISRWAIDELKATGTPETLPLVENSLLMMPLRWVCQAKLFIALIETYPVLKKQPDWVRTAMTLAGKVQTQFGLTAK